MVEMKPVEVQLSSSNGQIHQTASCNIANFTQRHSSSNEENDSNQKLQHGCSLSAERGLDQDTGAQSNEIGHFFENLYKILTELGFFTWVRIPRCA